MKNSKKQVYRVGIHLQQQALEFVVLQYKENLWYWCQGGSILIEENTVHAWQKLHQTLQAYPNNKINLGLSLDQVFIKQFALSRGLSDAEIYHYLQQQASRQFNDASTTLSLDYEWLPILDDKNNQQNLRMVAARTNQLINIQNRCQQLKLKLDKISVSAHALAQLINLIEKSGTPTGIISLNKDCVLFCVCYKQKVLFCQSFLRKSSNITTEIQQALQHYHFDYENLKIRQLYIAGIIAEKNLTEIQTVFKELNNQRLDLNKIIRTSDSAKNFTQYSQQLTCCIGLALSCET